MRVEQLRDYPHVEYRKPKLNLAHQILVLLLLESILYNLSSSEKEPFKEITKRPIHAMMLMSMMKFLLVYVNASLLLYIGGKNTSVFYLRRYEMLFLAFYCTDSTCYFAHFLNFEVPQKRKLVELKHSWVHVSCCLGGGGDYMGKFKGLRNIRVKILKLIQGNK